MKLIDKFILGFIILLVLGFLFNNPSKKEEAENGTIAEVESETNFFDYTRSLLDKVKPDSLRERHCNYCGTSRCKLYQDAYDYSTEAPGSHRNPYGASPDMGLALVAAGLRSIEWYNLQTKPDEICPESPYGETYREYYARTQPDLDLGDGK